MSERKRMDLAAFQQEGWLMEVNRQFFHPHGLALMVKRHDDGTITLDGVWDLRDDPEGIYFGNLDEGDGERIAKIAAEREKHRPHRERFFDAASDVEPIGFTVTAAVSPDE